MPDPSVGPTLVSARQRHVLTGDLEGLEFAIADYVAKWGQNWTGKPYIGEFGPNLGGMPTAVANMAMTVIRKSILATWEEAPPANDLGEISTARTGRADD